MAANISVAESEHLISKVKLEHSPGLHQAVTWQDLESASVNTSEDTPATTEQRPEQQNPSDSAADLELVSAAESKTTITTSTSWLRRCLPINIWLAAIATFILLFLGVFVVAGVVLGLLSLVIASWSHSIEKALKWFLGLFR
ncbi:hypothetical protein BDW67DRAFT_181371 [Aspergillus spinulosporus]